MVAIMLVALAMAGVLRGEDDFIATSNAVTTISNPHVFSNLLTATGGIVKDTGSITATTTLTSASDNIQLLPVSADTSVITLPAAADGLDLTFIVTGAQTGASITIDSAEGDNIEGILQVNDADVVCAGEDQLNIVTDGEVVGDRVQLISDGTSWYIGDSDWDAAAKLTCTDPS